MFFELGLNGSGLELMIFHKMHPRTHHNYLQQNHCRSDRVNMQSVVGILQLTHLNCPVAPLSVMNSCREYNKDYIPPQKVTVYFVFLAAQCLHSSTEHSLLASQQHLCFVVAARKHLSRDSNIFQFDSFCCLFQCFWGEISAGQLRQTPSDEETS